MKLPLMLAVLLTCLNVFAQDIDRGKISVVVFNEKNEPLENVTVELMKSTDSSLVKVSLTDKSGSAEFEKIRFGSYIIKAGMTNYTTEFSKSFTTSPEQLNFKLPDLLLKPKSTQMSEVVVTARKPFIQKLSDRIVVNVENSIVSAGSSAMDVLERSPGAALFPKAVGLLNLA